MKTHSRAFQMPGERPSAPHLPILKSSQLADNLRDDFGSHRVLSLAFVLDQSLITMIAIMPNYPLYEFGGSGPLIHLAVANGFPPETYRPMLDPLLAAHRAISFLPRALWDDPGPPRRFTDWRQTTDDLLAALRQRDLRGVIALGHSMGAVASALAVLAEPERFRALIMLDPTLLPYRYLPYIRLMKRVGAMKLHPMVRAAYKRRARFASVDEAFDYWRQKPLFHDWSDDALWLYVHSMTRPAPDNGSVELRWSPQWEAQYYQAVNTSIWDGLPRLNGLLPVLIVRGGHTRALREDDLRRFQELVPSAASAHIEGRGHLFPQSAPDETRAILERWLESLPPADRKSTRLNSSHQLISYAVFCLKKKKQTRLWLRAIPARRQPTPHKSTSPTQ